MNRIEFEALRDLPGKSINDNIRFVKSQSTQPILVAEGIRINNAHDVNLVLTIQFNPLVGSKTMNVHVPGLGPICRLDVDGPAHRPVGRCHKHSLQTEHCPGRNLPDHVTDKSELSGKSLKEVFDFFCKTAHISHTGDFQDPEAA